MCPLSPDNKTYPELHQKKHGQQIKRGDPASPLHADEISAEVLYPDAESSVQERHRPVGSCPEGHKNDPRGGTPLLQGQAEGALGSLAWRREGSEVT